MILPQSEAFHVLRHRLDCIPKLPLYSDTKYIDFNFFFLSFIDILLNENCILIYFTEV